jgi:predicted dinucleotide-binding enzyme
MLAGKAATVCDAAAAAEVVINATPGAVSLEVLAAASTKNPAGKVLIDVANPLDHHSLAD